MRFAAGKAQQMGVHEMESDGRYRTNLFCDFERGVKICVVFPRKIPSLESAPEKTFCAWSDMIVRFGKMCEAMCGFS